MKNIKKEALNQLNIDTDMFLNAPYCKLIEKISGEVIHEDISLSTKCVECEMGIDPIEMKKTKTVQESINEYRKLDHDYKDSRAWFIYQGNGLCKRHFYKKIGKELPKY